MKIATYLGEDGKVTDFFNKGHVRVFDKLADAWTGVQDVPLAVDDSMGIGDVRQAVNTALDAIRECEVFLLRDMRGVIRVYLEDRGYRVWTSKGTLSDQFDDVVQKEAEFAKAEAEKTVGIPAPESVGNPDDAHYRIDLIELLRADACHISRDLLMPFLETVSFAQLEIVCEHIPKWFASELRELDLRIASTDIFEGGNGMLLKVVPKSGARSVPPGRRPGKSGCSCGG